MSPKTLQSVIFATIVLLSACTLYGGLWYVTHLREVGMRERAQSQAVAHARNLELTALAKVRADTETSRAKLNDYLLTDNGVTVFLGQMEKAARARGLTIATQSVNVEPIDGTTAFASFVFTFEVGGTFASVTQFLALLETMPYQSTITSTMLSRESRSDSDSWKGVFTVKVTKEKKL